VTLLPPVDQALLPADIRSASTEVKQQYQAALSFEQSLVSELTKSLSKTAGDAMEGSPYAQLLPDALSDAITQAGGLGLARQMVEIPKTDTAAPDAATAGGASA
jgi:Rod binding domain-containing protein